MHVLASGGGGYLGCPLVALLLERGHTVRILDRFCFTEEPVAQFAGDERCEIVRGDIRHLQDAPGVLDGIDAVIHLAGLANDPSCDLDTDRAVDVNVESTVELANEALKRGVRRFVFASSCGVYGKGVFEVLDEESPANPVSVFGRTKLEAETALLRMSGSGFEPVIARQASLFGWSERMRFDLAVNQMAATAVRDGKIDVYGGGAQWRPFLHVRDAARALCLMAEAPADLVSGIVFNVGANDLNLRIDDLARRIAALVGDVELDHAKSDEDPRDYHVQFDRIQRVLGFTPEHTIEDGVREIRTALADASLDPFDDIHFNVRRMKQLLATPADQGGEPVAARFVPLARPTLGPEEEDAVVNTLRGGWLTAGARVQAFERAFAEKVGAREAVAVTSCTAALHLALVRYGVRLGDEVITSPITWPSTVNTIVNMGAKAVLADVMPGTLNIDPVCVESAITERTKVIMPVHLAGLPCAMDAIEAVAKRHGLHVLEDAAHAFGARYHGAPVGSRGNHTCFSFYPIKNITTVDGGMIALDDAEDARTLRILANNGLDAIAWDRYGRSAVAGPPQTVLPGYKYRMHDVAAAMGLEQLKKADAFLAARARLAGMYRSVLAEVGEVTVQDIPDGAQHAWHLMIVRLDLARLSKTRDEIAQALRRENVGTGVHFVGVHLHQYYRDALGITPESLPEATAASMDLLSLPLFPAMTDKNVREVVDALKKVLAHAR
jgi:dTDP-4-amino-4,6-dideoxygalactose transaminase/nucleoside-diphosphate-sugar epimerase